MTNAEIYPVMLTPFNGRNQIDVPTLKNLTEFYIQTGSNGLFVNCLSGEMYHLSDKERIRITQTVVNQSNGRQNVVSSGTFGHDLEKNIDFIKQVSDTGVSAVVINTNQVVEPKETEDVFKRNITKILEHTDKIQLGLYECPEPYHKLLTTGLLKWLAKTSRFVYLKETSCDLNQIKSKLTAVEGTPLKIFNANIPTAPDSILAGVSGISSIASNFYPEMVRLLADISDSQDEKMFKLKAFLSVSYALLHRKYPFSAKYFLQLRGMKINLKTRKDHVKFEYQDYVVFNELWKMTNLIAAELQTELFRS